MKKKNPRGRCEKLCERDLQLRLRPRVGLPPLLAQSRQNQAISIQMSAEIILVAVATLSLCYKGVPQLADAKDYSKDADEKWTHSQVDSTSKSHVTSDAC